MRAPRNDTPPPWLPASAGLFQRVCDSFAAEPLPSWPLLTAVLTDPEGSLQGTWKQEAGWGGGGGTTYAALSPYWVPSQHSISHAQHAGSIFCNQMLMSKLSQVYLRPRIHSCILELETPPSTSFPCLSVQEIGIRVREVPH